jgi:hypothetical protein
VAALQFSTIEAGIPFMVCDINFLPFDGMVGILAVLFLIDNTYINNVSV